MADSIEIHRTRRSKKHKSKKHHHSPTSSSDESRSPSRNTNKERKGFPKSPNWTTDSVLDLLTSLLDEKAIIKGHSGHSGGKEARRQAWCRVTACVNANSMQHRTMEQCQSKAANFCSETRKRFVEMKKEMGKTGGGPGDEEVMKHLSEAEKLSLAYTGWATAAGVVGTSKPLLQKEPSETNMSDVSFAGSDTTEEDRLLQRLEQLRRDKARKKEEAERERKEKERREEEEKKARIEQQVQMEQDVKGCSNCCGVLKKVMALMERVVTVQEMLAEVVHLDKAKEIFKDTESLLTPLEMEIEAVPSSDSVQDGVAPIAIITGASDEVIGEVTWLDGANENAKIVASDDEAENDEDICTIVQTPKKKAPTRRGRGRSKKY